MMVQKRHTTLVRITIIKIMQLVTMADKITRRPMSQQVRLIRRPIKAACRCLIRRMRGRCWEQRMLVVRSIGVASITLQSQMEGRYITANRCLQRLKMALSILIRWSPAELIDIQIRSRANRKYLDACSRYLEVSFSHSPYFWCTEVRLQGEVKSWPITLCLCRNGQVLTKHSSRVCRYKCQEQQEARLYSTRSRVENTAQQVSEMLSKVEVNVRVEPPPSTEAHFPRTTSQEHQVHPLAKDSSQHQP